MRKIKSIPRIIKIHRVEHLKVYCAFNNGEHRIIDFTKLFKLWNVKKTDIEFKLNDPDVFEKAEVRNNTLSWPEITQKIKLSDGLEFEAELDFDPIVLYENSIPDEEKNKRYRIGGILKSQRQKAGLTQQELALKSGTTKNYISRIENDKSDIELTTLRKIIEIGLDKKLEIVIS